MAKPIFIATFRNGIPNPKDKKLIRKTLLEWTNNEYNIIILFEDKSDKDNKFEILNEN